MKITVIGATGGVGSRLLPLLIAEGHEVSGLYRSDESRREIEEQGARGIPGDLMEMTEDDFAKAIQGTEAVVFSAGAGGAGIEQATKIDGDARGKLVAAMERQNVRRLILVSVFMDAGRNKDLSDTFEHYMAEKRRADADVAQSDTDWVLLRPGKLSDEDGDGYVTAGRAIPYGQTARGHVAKAIAELLKRPGLRFETIEITDGETPLSAAMDRLVR